MPIGRRDLLKWLGLGGSVGLIGGGAELVARSEPATTAASRHPNPAVGTGAPGRGPGGLAGPYHGMTDPPDHLGPRALDVQTLPPPFSPAGPPRELTLHLVETRLEVGREGFVDAVAYDGTAPGPLIRAALGQELSITLVNQTGSAHTLHFHGAYDTNEDGWEPVAPGFSRTYRLVPAAAGLHPYHCHTSPYAQHIARGMYGVMIVDPATPRPPAHEFVLTLSGWDLDGDGRNELYAWNGIAGFFTRFPLKVPVGELVRLYVTNLVEYDPVASFHLHAHTFDVFRSGTSLVPDTHTDVISLGPTERAIVEFRLPRRGRYMFHPHQGQMIERGAMGWIVAV